MRCGGSRSAPSIHMHELSLRFHLERKTGGLTRVLERGRNAIETIVRMVILQLVPTIIELVMIVAVLLLAVRLAIRRRHPRSPSRCISAYTYYATEWRIGIRRKMNDSDTDANVKAIDSLLNYETVKYFSAEEREAERYDRAMARYEEARDQRLYLALRCSMPGRRRSSPSGWRAAMVMCAYDMRGGTKTVGDFVLINAMMIQLYQPLNFMGMVYREIKQAIIDIEMMFSDHQPRSGNQGRAECAAARGQRAASSGSRMSCSPTSRRGRSSKGISFEVPAGKTVAVVGPSGAGKSTIVAAAVPLLRSVRRAASRSTVRTSRKVTQKSLRQVDRHGAAGHRAVQRHHPLQHPLRPLGSHRRGSGGGGAAARRSTASSAWRRRATTPRSASAA